MKSLLASLGIVTMIAAAPAFDVKQEDPWKVPVNYEKMKNPVTADNASIMAGKEVYISYCTSCHGVDGKGSGKRSGNLNTPPTDFTSASFQKQTDGSLLYKVYFGHKEMPGFKKGFQAMLVSMKTILVKQEFPVTWLITFAVMQKNSRN